MGEHGLWIDTSRFRRIAWEGLREQWSIVSSVDVYNTLVSLAPNVRRTNRDLTVDVGEPMCADPERPTAIH